MHNYFNMLSFLFMLGLLSQAAFSVEFNIFPQFLLKNQTGKNIRVTVDVDDKEKIESLVDADSYLRLPDPKTISSIKLKIVEGLSPHFTHEVNPVAIEEAVNDWILGRRVTLNVFRDSIGPIQKGFKYTINYENKKL